MQELGSNNSIIIFLVILAIWTIPWKGWALWKSARNNSKVWFVILLIMNTVGILEILYIFLFSKQSREKRNPNPTV